VPAGIDARVGFAGVSITEGTLGLGVGFQANFNSNSQSVSEWDWTGFHWHRSHWRDA